MKKSSVWLLFLAIFVDVCGIIILTLARNTVGLVGGVVCVLVGAVLIGIYLGSLMNKVSTK